MSTEPFTIDREHLMEHKPHTFTAEASELGLRPGQWPAHIKVGPGQFGNGQHFILMSITPQRARYSQDLGCAELLIFND